MNWAIIQDIGDIIRRFYYWVINNPTLFLWSLSVITVGATLVYLSLKSKSVGRKPRFFARST